MAEMAVSHLAATSNKLDQMSTRYYCKGQCLGSSHMVIVHLVLQPPLCGIGCRHDIRNASSLEIF